jgi:hypothetical protein
MAMADDQAAFLGLANSVSDESRGDPERDKLSMGCFQVAVLATAAPHMLDHQETHDTESVDPEGAECVAFQNLTGDLDKLFFGDHCCPPRPSMRPTA